MSIKDKVKLLIVEESLKKSIIQEMDVMSIAYDIIPIISHLISAGFISFKIGKALLKLYEDGAATKDDIKQIATSDNPEATLRYFMNQRLDDEDLDYLDKTQTSPTVDIGVINPFEDEESSTEELEDTEPESFPDTAILPGRGTNKLFESIDKHTKNEKIKKYFKKS